MFVEHNLINAKGSIEVIVGSMFSGKTEELLRRVKRAELANQRCVLLKPSEDNRYAEDHVVTHSKQQMKSKNINHSEEIINLTSGFDVVAIDEVQFLDQDLPKVCNHLANRGKRVIVAGLNLDSNGLPFGCVPELLARADFITKLHAICKNCGNIAQFTFCKEDKKQLVLLGETDKYEALCRDCFNEFTPNKS